MASAVEIANAALVGLGHQPIQSFLDDSDEARAVRTVYDLCRDDVMMAHPWNFATERVRFALLNENPSAVTGEYNYVYQLPTDTLRVLWLEPSSSRFAVERGGKLYTNIPPPLNGVVIRRITDAGAYPANFVMALVYRLQAELCNALTSSRGKSNDYYQRYRQKLEEARVTDELESYPDPDDREPLNEVRLLGLPGQDVKWD